MSQVTIYKWTDAEGNPQFGSSPPAEGIEYTEKQYDPNENVIPAVDTDSSNRRQESEPVLPRSNSEAVDFGDIFSPEVIVKLFEDANNVGKFSNNRTKTLNADPGQ